MERRCRWSVCGLYHLRQHNHQTIWTGEKKKTHSLVPHLECNLITRRTLVLWLSYVIWNLVCVCVCVYGFFLFFSLNVKHPLLKKSNPSDDFFTPLKWKWCIWQNSCINIIKEFNLQKPQHLLAWREYWITFLWIQLMDLMALRQPFIS